MSKLSQDKVALDLMLYHVLSKDHEMSHLTCPKCQMALYIDSDKEINEYFCPKCNHREEMKCTVIIDEQEYTDLGNRCGWEKSENASHDCSGCGNRLMITREENLICIACEYIEEVLAKDEEKTRLEKEKQALLTQENEQKRKEKELMDKMNAKLVLLSQRGNSKFYHY